jgi:hypothetical protein
MRSVLQNITLKAGGHTFIPGLNGLDLHIDTILRIGSETVGASDDSTGFADADATNGTCVLRQYVALNNPLGLDGAKNLDGAIPIAAMKNGASELSFQIGAALVPSFAGVTIDGVAGTVTALVAYGTKLRIPSTWRTVHRRDTQSEPVVRPNGGLEYLVIADRTTDAGVFGTDQVDYSVVRVEQGGVLLTGAAQAATDAAKVSSVLQFGYQRAPGSADLSLSAPKYFPLLQVPVGAPRSTLPREEVVVHLDTRGSRTSTSIRYRETGITNVKSDYFRAMLVACGVRDGEKWLARPAASARKYGSKVDPMLDAEVWFNRTHMRSAGFAVPAESNRV